ncbi:MAG TPA: PEP-utilizing enzyme, partial [Acidimicrobiales bacterium]|nr:PEP-utilizing enzyme [Acidimicrobiales bacterium]
GRGLARRGVIADAEDILFLLPAEVEAGEGELGPLVASRRAAHERWRTVVPPEVIGGAEGAPEDSSPPATGSGVQGLGVSRGVVTGPARVILDLADAHRLEPGDVLVCVMTSPAWTPLFGLASAVVADTGGMGSHPAIASREYGIPCVLGTGVATTTIPDGALVTVDGEAGTVEVGVPSESLSH